MTVSIKTPANRASGPPSGGSGGRPIPAPRVVNNRRIRTGGVLLAVLLLVLGAALSALALLSATRTSSYLAVGHQVQIGSQITAQDLTTVQLSGGQGLSAIPADQINSVIGQRAAVTLLPGTLVASGELTDQNLVKPNDAQIGISVRSSSLPSATLRAGDQVWLVPLATPTGGTAGTVRYDATVIDVGTPGSDGSVALHVAVDANSAPSIVATNGGLAIVLKPKD